MGYRVSMASSRLRMAASRPPWSMKRATLPSTGRRHAVRPVRETPQPFAFLGDDVAEYPPVGQLGGEDVRTSGPCRNGASPRRRCRTVVPVRIPGRTRAAGRGRRRSATRRICRRIRIRFGRTARRTRVRGRRTRRRPGGRRHRPRVTIRPSGRTSRPRRSSRPAGRRGIAPHTSRGRGRPCPEPCSSRIQRGDRTRIRSRSGP